MGDFVPLIFTLIMVVVILYLSFLFTRYMAKSSTKISGTRYMKILDKIPLGQDKHLVMVKINKKFFLLGVSGQAISMLSEIKEDDIVPIEDFNKYDRISVDGFKSILQSFTNKKNTTDTTD